jgi:hypothetical protein
VSSTGFAGLASAVIKLFAASTDIRFIKEALERPLGRAQILTAAGLAAGVSVGAALFRAVRTENNGVAITGRLDRSSIRSRPSVDDAGFRLARINSGVRLANINDHARIWSWGFWDAGAREHQDAY